MRTIAYDRYPGGRPKALTLSYDDGHVYDRRLVGILNRYGVKGTFHLNSGLLGREEYLEPGEVRALYAGHEVAVHTVTHPHLTDVPPERVVWEIMEDRARLEELVGYPVRGMSYPYGDYNEEIVRLLPALGIAYSRTVQCHHTFRMPRDFHRWEATCHHRDRLLERAEELIQSPSWRGMSLMYVWGHGFEFERNGNWELLEQFCERVGGRDDIWYATNIEICDYMQALRSLRSTARGDVVHNPSALPVWISVDGEAVEIPPGGTVQAGSGSSR